MGDAASINDFSKITAPRVIFIYTSHQHKPALFQNQSIIELVRLYGSGFQDLRDPKSEKSAGSKIPHRRYGPEVCAGVWGGVIVGVVGV